MKVALTLAPHDQLATAGFKTGGRKVYGYSMPLGVAYLSAVLEKAGHNVALLDPNPRGMNSAKIAEWLVAQRPDVVGISSMTHMAPAAYEVAQYAKRNMPGVPIVMGGSHCTVWPERVLPECAHIDVVAIGEGESRIAQIVESCRDEQALAKIPGLIFRAKNGEGVRTGDPVIQKDLDAIPFPARHLFDHALYLSWPDQVRKQPTTNVITSRGCSWHRCKFCFEGGRYMPPYRRRSPENVAAEFVEIKRKGFNGVSIWDDNFCVGRAWVAKLCALLREANLGVTWTCYARADTLTEEMVKDIGSVGCFSVYFGFESGDQGTLDLIDKGTTLDQMRKGVRLCHKYGVEVRGSFILGMPSDTPAIARQTIAFAKELDLDSVKFMLYTPEPGTPLHDMALQHGKVVREGFLGSLTKATYVPEGYASIEQLETLARDANRGYLLRPQFILKKLRSIRSWQDFRRYLDGFFMVVRLGRA